MPAAARFALCQAHPSPPPEKVLTSAFDEARGLTAMDARHAVQRGCGILADRLDHSAALAMRARLGELGYSSEVVSESELELPRPFHVRRADVSASELIVYDVYGRPTPLQWPSILVVHAGTYPEGELVTTKEAGWEFRGEMTVAWDAEHDYVETDTVTLELVVRDRKNRYAFAPAPFDYGYLAERKRNDSRENFAVLVDDIVRGAHTSIPWLAFRPPGDGFAIESLRRYPSRRLFERHLAWLTWYATKPG